MMAVKCDKKTLYSTVVSHLENASQATKIIKGVMLIGGSLVAGVAQFSDIKPTGIESQQIVGIVGCAFVFLAAIWTLAKERDATEELKIAVRVQDEAENLKAQFAELSDIYDDVDRAANLIVANSVIRGYLERLCSSDSAHTEEQILENIFALSARFLSLSMGLSGNNEWTICAYRAQPDAGGKDRLKLIEHSRAIQCDKSAAREWEEGVGVAGICYSTEREIIVPDFQSDGVGSLFNVGPRQRSYDASRYQSIIAVPIQVDKAARPWGVITATSDRKYHFTSNADGIQYAEGARVLAGTIALAVAIKRGLAKPGGDV